MVSPRHPAFSSIWCHSWVTLVQIQLSVTVLETVGKDTDPNMSKMDSITSLTVSGSAVWLLWLPKQMSGASVWSFWSTCQSITGNLGLDKNTLLNPGSGDRHADNAPPDGWGLFLHFTNSGNLILPSLQSLQKPCQYWELGCWNHGLFNHDNALFTPNQNSPPSYPHLKTPVSLPVTLWSAVTQAISNFLSLTNGAENSSTQSGGSSQGAMLLNLSTNQTRKYYGKRRVEFLLCGWGGRQGLMGADSRQVLNIFDPADTAVNCTGLCLLWASPQAPGQFVRSSLEMGGRRKAEMPGAMDWVVVFPSDSCDEVLIHNVMVVEMGH